MSDLIKTAKEFAEEMEKWLELSRKADEAAADADAKYGKLVDFLRESEENRIAAMPGNRFKAKDKSIVEWCHGSAALTRKPGVTEEMVVANLKQHKALAEFVRETYDSESIKAAWPYGGKSRQKTSLDELGLFYKDPVYRLKIKLGAKRR